MSRTIRRTKPRGKAHKYSRGGFEKYHRDWGDWSVPKQFRVALNRQYRHREENSLLRTLYKGELEFVAESFKRNAAWLYW